MDVLSFAKLLPDRVFYIKNFLDTIHNKKVVLRNVRIWGQTCHDYMGRIFIACLLSPGSVNILASKAFPGFLSKDQSSMRAVTVSCQCDHMNTSFSNALSYIFLVFLINLDNSL